MSAVVDAISGGLGSVVDAVTGGSPKNQSSNSITQDIQKTLGGPTSNQLQANQVSSNQLGGLQDILSNQTGFAQGQSNQVNDLFRNLLTNFATGTGQPTPQQLQEATDYVHQTFTIPAQTQYNQFLNQAQTAESDRASALGRNSTDSAYQREFAGQASQAAQNLADQQGSLIAQRADYLSNQLPTQQLSSLLQGAQYFNTPLQQAMSNRLNLLNASTQQQNLGLQNQIASGGAMSTSTGQNSAYVQPSLGQQIAGGAQGIGSIGQGLGSLFAAGSTGGSGSLGGLSLAQRPTAGSGFQSQF